MPWWCRKQSSGSEAPQHKPRVEREPCWTRFSSTVGPRCQTQDHLYRFNHKLSGATWPRNGEMEPGGLFNAEQLLFLSGSLYLFTAVSWLGSDLFICAPPPPLFLTFVSVASASRLTFPNASHPLRRRLICSLFTHFLCISPFPFFS